MWRVFQASSPEVEVDARTVRAVVSGMLIPGLARQLFSGLALDDVPKIQWVAQQEWLNAYKGIQDNLGADTLYAIGRRIPYSADFPDETMHDVPSALAAIDVAYHRAHRGGEIGVYRYVEVGPEHYQIQCDNPYPNMFDLGIVTSLVERFRRRAPFRVKLTQQGPGKLWDNACMFDVQKGA